MKLNFNVIFVLIKRFICRSNILRPDCFVGDKAGGDSVSADTGTEIR
jgi:hypothetical protein